MYKRLYLFAAVLLLTPAVAQCQTQPVAQGPAVVDARPEETFWSDPPFEPEPAGGERVRFSMDYLLWWVRSGPVNSPLVSTGSVADAVPGALGQPGTRVLFGDEALHFGTSSGIRVGGAVDLAYGFAVEGNLFALERRTAGFIAVSDDNGNPLIARPVFNDQTSAPSAYTYAVPGLATGSVAVAAQTRLQGCELNLAMSAFQDGPFSFHLFAGFRALELDEDLNVTGNTAALAPGLLTFLGAPADPPNSLTDFDDFKTYNRFYGGQLGGRLEWHADRFDVDLTGKLALGTTQQLAIVNGVSTLNTPGAAPATNPGGLLAEPSNIGRYYRSTFGVVPEVGLNFSYWVAPCLKCTLGYSFLYWNRVARPGNTIDNTVNPAQVARDVNFGNGLGDARPAFQFGQSDFWAQGFSVGLEYRY